MAESLMQIRPSVDLKKIFIRCTTQSTKGMLPIQPYDFEIKYIPGKEVALADVVSRVNSQEMELKGLDFTTRRNPMHDTNTDVNDMC